MSPFCHFPELDLLDVVVCPPTLGCLYRAFQLRVSESFLLWVLGEVQILRCYCAGCIPPGGGFWVGGVPFVKDFFIHPLDVVCEGLDGCFHFFWGLWLSGLGLIGAQSRFESASPLLCPFRICYVS